MMGKKRKKGIAISQFFKRASDSPVTSVFNNARRLKPGKYSVTVERIEMRNDGMVIDSIAVRIPKKKTK